MSDHKDDPTFNIMGQEITLISDDLDWGTNTAAIIGDKIHYMGPEAATLGTAICAFQEMNNWELTPEEIRQVMIENGILTGDDNDKQETNIETDDQ
jgi:hypothetical protein